MAALPFRRHTRPGLGDRECPHRLARLSFYRRLPTERLGGCDFNRPHRAVAPNNLTVVQKRKMQTKTRISLWSGSASSTRLVATARN